jgi:hypothetical protein
VFAAWGSTLTLPVTLWPQREWHIYQKIRINSQ